MAHHLRTTACLGLLGLLFQTAIVGAQTPQEFKATGTEQVTAAIAAFKAAIGGSDNGSAIGSQGSGYRQITWDDVPDANASPAYFPKNFYSAVMPRGFTLGYADNYHQFEVSAVESNPSGAAPLFGNRSALFPTLFTTFSPGRIMRSAGENPFYVGLSVPGSSDTASVSAFGAVFIDVDRENVTSLTFYDAEHRLLGTFFVPAASGDKTVSFLGVVFPPGAGSISSVVVAPGFTHVQQPQDEGGGRDLVALDDIIYAEPRLPDPPTITITSPTTNPTYAAGGPFLTLAAVSTDTHTVTWADNRGRTGFFARDWTEHAWRDINIPLDPGVTVFTVTATGVNGGTATDTITVNSDTFSYHLAEGSTGTFFDTDILIANPTATPAPVTITFLKEDGSRLQHAATIPALSRSTIRADEIEGVEAAAFATTVVSTARVPLVVERAMFWDDARYDGNGAAAVNDASRTWYFAEGVQNFFFNTYVLLQNPGEETATATLTFNRDDGTPPVLHEVSLPPLSRVTVDAGAIPDLVGRSFGLKVEATHPIVAERSTYFESTPDRLWAGGHGSPGTPHLSSRWYFAEGATGDFRDTFLLLSNPGDVAAPVSLNFYREAGQPVTLSETVAPHSRLTIPVDWIWLDQDGTPYRPLADALFAVEITSFYSIVAERAMYWNGVPGPWADGTTTLGQTTPGSRWGFAEGRIGGPLEYHTYIRVACHSSAMPADVRVTFLRGGGAQIEQTYTVSKLNPITIDVNSVPGLEDGDTIAAIVESINGADIFTERSMYWNSGGAFWAGGLATAGTRLP